MNGTNTLTHALTDKQAPPLLEQTGKKQRLLVEDMENTKITMTKTTKMKMPPTKKNTTKTMAKPTKAIQKEFR